MNPHRLLSPIGVPTRDTVAFISTHTEPPATLIEVGCGRGEVARELIGRGFRVIALDSDPESVSTAVANGVHAIVASWPEFDCQAVDAVVFTRSLHHMEALGDAVRRAKELLRPGGVLLVEDFAYDSADQSTIDWFLEILESPEARTLIVPTDQGHDLVTDLLKSSAPLDTWAENHDHDLHTVDQMSAAIAREFGSLKKASVPYLYRYLVRVLPENPEAAEFLARLYREEARLGMAGNITLIGCRLIAARASI